MITAITGGKVITVTGQTYEKATVLTEDGKSRQSVPILQFQKAHRSLTLQDAGSPRD